MTTLKPSRTTSIWRAIKRSSAHLEKWQPAFRNWWNDAGPADSAKLEVYLRTAISVDKDGWANFSYVRMPEYRWGIFLVPRDETRAIHFGDHAGKPAWQEVPGEYRPFCGGLSSRRAIPNRRPSSSSGYWE